MSITRYYLVGFADDLMFEDTLGKWVRFSDHESEIASLKQKLATARNDALEEAVAICNKQRDGWIPGASPHSLARNVEAELCGMKIRSLKSKEPV